VVGVQVRDGHRLDRRRVAAERGEVVQQRPAVHSADRGSGLRRGLRGTISGIDEQRPAIALDE
jgi:hypothetical protein